MNRRGRSIFTCIAAILFGVLALAGCGGGGGGGGGDALTIVSTSPAGGATNVDPATLTQFVVNFSKAMDTQADLSEVPVQLIESKDGSDTDITDLLDGGAWSDGDKTITLDVSSYFFKEGATYTFTAFAGMLISTDGKTLDEDYVATFTTSATVPTVVATDPASGATGISTDPGTIITVDFSEPMDTTTLKDNASLGAYTGDVDAAWSNGDATLTLTLIDALADSTTYVLSLGAQIKDARGTEMGQVFTLPFSTGSSLATGSLTGTLSSDPDSAYDNSLVRAQVMLFAADPFGSGDAGAPLGIVQAASNGAWHFSYLTGGDVFYLAAGIDSNHDGKPINPDLGDAVGAYAYLVNRDPVMVSDSDLDFALKDTEAISGRITLDGSTGDPDLSGSAPVISAFIGTFAETGEAYLTNDPTFFGTGDAVAEYSGADNDFDYFLNPFFYPTLSVSGVKAEGTVASVDRHYIPTGDYRVVAVAESGPYTYIGFSQPAEIAGAGDDATGTDITLFQATGVWGEVVRTDSMESMPAMYGSARVCLLGWPLKYVLSDGGASTLSSAAPASAPLLGAIIPGNFSYMGAPAGKPVAFHVWPDSADSAVYLPTNYAYQEFSSDGSIDNQLMLMKKSLMQSWSSLVPGAPTLDMAKAQVGGSVRIPGSGPIVGATVTLPGATTYYFTSTDLDAVSTTGGTRNIDEGPQFIMVNVDVPTDGQGTVTATAEGYTFDPVILPLRAGELSILNAESAIIK